MLQQCKVVDFCVVEFEGKLIEVETITLLGLHPQMEHDSFPVSINKTHMLISPSDLSKLMDDLIK